jgi:type II secretory pathway component PulF
MLFDSFSVERPFLLIVMIYIMKMIPILFIVSFIVITFLFLYLLYALKNKKYLIIEKYLKVKGIRVLLQKYFTLKFAVYFNELLKDHIDAHSIMKLLNEKMNHSDIKIMIYEIYTKMNNGLSFEEGMYNLEYFDPLFILMYKLFLQSPQDVKSLQGYIDLTLEWVHVRINKMVKIVVPAVYSFVAIFVISIYLAAVLPLMNIIGDL